MAESGIKPDLPLSGQMLLPLSYSDYAIFNTVIKYMTLERCWNNCFLFLTNPFAIQNNIVSDDLKTGCIPGGRLLDISRPGCCRRCFRGQRPDVRFWDKIWSLICLTTYRDRSIGSRFDRKKRLREIRRWWFRLYWLGCPMWSFSVYKIQIRMGLFRCFLLKKAIFH